MLARGRVGWADGVHRIVGRSWHKLPQEQGGLRTSKPQETSVLNSQSLVNSPGVSRQVGRGRVAADRREDMHRVPT